MSRQNECLAAVPSKLFDTLSSPKNICGGISAAVATQEIVFSVSKKRDRASFRASCIKEKDTNCTFGRPSAGQNVAFQPDWRRCIVYSAGQNSMRRKNNEVGMFASGNPRSRLRIYDGIAEKLSLQIRGGTPPFGAKMPSVREFGRQLKVSPNTVTRAYWALEGEGLIEARPQSGFYVSHSNENRPGAGLKTELKDPLPVDKGRLSSHMKFLPYVMRNMTDPKYLFLSFGSPGLSVLDLENFKRSIGTAKTELGIKGLGYNWPNWPNGYQPLLRQISREYFNCGVKIDPGNLLLTSGVSESLNIALRALTRPGDIIAVETPLFPMWFMVAQSCGLRIIEIPVKPDTGLDLDYLERALTKNAVRAVLSMPNFHNPTSYCLSDSAKSRLVSMAAKWDIPLIENDIYSELYFGATRPKPAKTYDRTGNVVLLSSFSKVFAPGLRVGWIAGGKYMRELSEQRFVCNASTNPLNEASISDFIGRGLYKRHLKKVRLFCAENFKRLETAISNYFPLGTKITRPGGGLLSWIELPDNIDALRLHNEALKKNILVFPGNIYSLKPRYLSFLAFNFSLVWTEAVETAMREIGDLAKNQEHGLAGRK